MVSLRRAIAPYVARFTPLQAVHRVYWRARLAYERRREYQGLQLAFSGSDPEPSFKRPTSQLCTAAQCLEDAYAQRCAELKSPPRFNRKQWEFAYILQALQMRGCVRPGVRGLGFGCGNEPLPSVFAAKGCVIVATDQSAATARERGWIAGQQHSASIETLNARRLCRVEEFRERVSFREVDMNAIPADLRGFDFLWSACSLEHLGSLRHGLDFICNAMKCLKPNGVAVHTTEFNLSSLDDTLEDSNCVIYRKRDIDQLEEELQADGHELATVLFNPGRLPPDRYIDAPPYRSSPHLKLRLQQYVVTSIGLIVRCAQSK